ncbi:putative demethylmenaquinone methyltransferase [Pseudomonas amygdali pv. ulmi]|uniref:Putative 4-hydroxy-4-methyl-2-oxoglutarate aldolase n=1 Tax=Pseudomonas amygdali pv. ulmi TaxID=251720 RepID=A0A0Q0CH05_PSEA0|nr:RraA family protein [Pseudomonas amygdali]KPZ10739.1 putative demethylmenaquinone methyltransferase [Pseudomonas amygdali pv. ulmi]KWS13550.1 dimethylmenaquinone methyltransferase [Pseudomonas amygdali pv. ulmi]
MIDEQQLEAKLQRVSFATLGHFLEDGFVSHVIGAQLGGIKMIGRARTVRVANADAFAVNQAMVTLQPGEVLVIEMLGDHLHACVGTVTSCAAAAQGARGIVVDGVVTDILELRAARLPVFARGTSLLTTKLRSDPASAQNIEIECGGVRVVPGDWVLGDDNGLLITSTSILAAVIDTALASDAAEPALMERMKQGESISTVLRLG